MVLYLPIFIMSPANKHPNKAIKNQLKENNSPETKQYLLS